MKLPRRQFLHLAAGAAALPVVSRIALALDYPVRPVRWIVGYAAGGGNDIAARLMGQWLAERLGQQFVIENRPGANSNIGTETVVRAPPDGRGLTVVGDDAQSIYSFRAATVRNILDFPDQFEPPARIITLDQNYRSTQSILDACNGMIGFASERFTKNLWSERKSKQKSFLTTVADETAQARYVAQQILDAREAGVRLSPPEAMGMLCYRSTFLKQQLKTGLALPS